MKRIKVTVTEMLTLSPGAELIENFSSDGEELGPHIKVGGQQYCPFMIWMVFEPRSCRTPEELKIGLGHGYNSTPDTTVYDEYFASEEVPVVDHTIEVIDDGKENGA